MLRPDEAPLAHDAPELAVGPCVSLRRAIGSPAWNVGTGQFSHHASRSPSATRDLPSVACVEYERGADVLRVAQHRGEVRRIDARTGLLRGHVTLDQGPLYPDDASALGLGSCCFSSDGSTIAATGARSTTGLFDARTGALLCALAPCAGPQFRATRVAAFSPDGALVLGLTGAPFDPTAYTARDAWYTEGATNVPGLALWDARTGALLREAPGGGSAVFSAAGDAYFAGDAFLKGCSRVVCVGLDGVERWRSALPEMFGTGLVASPDGELLFAYGGEPDKYTAPMSSLAWELRALDALTGVPRWRASLRRRPRAALCVGELLWLLFDGMARAYEAATGEPVAEVSLAPPVGLVAVGSCFAASPDGATLYVPIGSRVARFDVGTGEERSDGCDARGAIRAIALAASGARVASSADEAPVRVHSTASGEETTRLDGLGNAAISLAMTPDERYLFACAPFEGVISSLEVGISVGAVPKSTSALGGFTTLTTLVRVAASADGTVGYVLGEDAGSRRWAMICFDAATGAARWAADLGRDNPSIVDVRGDPRTGDVRIAAQPNSIKSARPGAPVVSSRVLYRAAASPLAPSDFKVFAVHDEARAWALATTGPAASRALVLLDPESARRFPAAAAHGAPAESLFASRDGAWLVTGSLSGDAIVWRVTGEGSALAAQSVGLVALSLAGDRLTCAEVDAAGTTMVLGTELGVVVVCSLRASS